MIQGPPADLESVGTTDALFPVVYGELKRIARRHLRGSGGRVTVCTTELVHEAFLRLSHRGDVAWESRAHFFGSASRAMRQVLVGFARRRHASKRDGTPISLSIADSERALECEFEELIAIDDALTQLDALNPRLRQIVELRFFGGIREPEIAEMLSVSVRTVERDWLKARMFLFRELQAARS
jgi:RNA polymerase sigma factor (TIGR02999 family)